MKREEAPFEEETVIRFSLESRDSIDGVLIGDNKRDESLAFVEG